MIEGYHYVVPFRKIWIVACALDGKEYLEIRTVDRNDPDRDGVLCHMESPIGYFLTDLLSADLKAMDVQFPDLQQKIQSINDGISIAKNFNLIQGTKNYWLAQGAVFAPFIAAKIPPFLSRGMQYSLRTFILATALAVTISNCSLNSFF